jgi:hypothetical protein
LLNERRPLVSADRAAAVGRCISCPTSALLIADLEQGHYFTDLVGSP